jgi:hypothetical protein
LRGLERHRENFAESKQYFPPSTVHVAELSHCGPMLAPFWESAMDLIRSCCACMLLLFLAACGGGGGAAAPSAPPVSEAAPSTPPITWYPHPIAPWIHQVELSPPMFGEWSAVALNDGTSVILKREHSVDPNTITLLHRDQNGLPLGSYLVASKTPDLANISRPILYSPVLKTDGHAVWVLWRDYQPSQYSDEPESAHLRRWTAEAGLGETMSVEPRFGGGITDADLDVAADGSAILCWLEAVPNPSLPFPVHFGPKLAAVQRYSPDTGWSAPQTLAEPDTAVGEDRVKIAATSSRADKAVVAWVHGSDGMHARIESVQLLADGSWSAVQTVFNPVDPSLAGTVSNWKLVMGDTGATTAIWGWMSWDTKQQGVDINHLDPVTGWEGPQTITTTTEDDWTASISRKGPGAIAWRNGYDDVVAWFDDTGFQGARALTQTEEGWGSALEAPRVVADDQGRLTVIWGQIFYDGTGQYAHLGAVRGVRYSPATGWEQEFSVSTPDNPATPAIISNAAAGRATVLWRQGLIGAGASGTFFSSAFQMAP